MTFQVPYSGPVSSHTISETINAAKVFRKHYPSWQSLGSTADLYTYLLTASCDWKTCHRKFTELVHIDVDQGIKSVKNLSGTRSPHLIDFEHDVATKSMRNLAKSGTISLDGFNTYLELLKASATCGTIRDASLNEHRSAIIDSLDREHVWIVPFRDETKWSFCVVMPTSVHYYESGLIQPLADSQAHKDKTAAYVLLGIRLVSQGYPQADFETISNGFQDWCTRILLELVCGELDPTPRSVEIVNDLLEDLLEKEKEPSFFRDALGSLCPSPEPSFFHDALGSLCPSPEPSLNGRAIDEQDSSGSETSLQSGELSESYPHGEDDQSILNQELYNTTPNISASSSEEDNNIRNMLEILSDATLAVRRIGPSRKRDLESLCNIIAEERPKGCFHLRSCKRELYNWILNEVTNPQRIPSSRLDHVRGLIFRARHGAIKASFKQDLREECQQWFRIRDWCKVHTLSERSVLCAIPLEQDITAVCLRELWEQLQRSDSSFRRLIEYTEDLCDTIVRSDLPDFPLAIELYPTKRHEVFCREAFKGFMSTERRPVIEISRLPRQNR